MTDASAIDKFLGAIESATISCCDAWSADATLDATVPNWRLHATGGDAIRAEYAKWFADPGRFDELHRHVIGHGVAPLWVVGCDPKQGIGLIDQKIAHAFAPPLVCRRGMRDCRRSVSATRARFP